MVRVCSYVPDPAFPNRRPFGGAADRIVALLLHYEDSRVRRVLRARPHSAGLTGFTLRREMESWASELWLNTVSRSIWRFPGMPSLRAPLRTMAYLREGLTRIGHQLEAIAGTHMGLEALGRLKTIGAPRHQPQLRHHQRQWF